MSNEQLLPCPFCGNADTPIVIHHGDGSAAVCSTPAGGCGVQMPWEFEPYDAVEAWNNRAPDASDEEG